jgi:hypothetical protein
MVPSRPLREPGLREREPQPGDYARIPKFRFEEEPPAVQSRVSEGLAGLAPGILVFALGMSGSGATRSP